MRVPERIITIEGQQLRADVSNDVEEVTVDDAEGRSDHFQITINNHHGRWTDLELFNEGNLITISLGYRGGPYLFFKGRIMAPGGTWPESGNPRLTVEGYDLGYALGRDRKNRAWVNMRDSDIAASIAKEAGFKASVQSTPVVHEQITQEDISDLGFLFQRAAEWGYDVWMEDETLHFERRTSKEYDVELRWGYNIKSIGYIRKSVADVSTAVIVKGWDPIHKYELTGKAGVDITGDPMEVVGAEITARVLGEVHTFLSRKIPESQQEAQELAEAEFRHLVENYVEGELEIEGEPKLRRGSLFLLTGVGKRFEGVYRVTGSRHSIGGNGYITRLTFNNQRQVVG